MAMSSRVVFHARKTGPFSCRFMRCLFTKTKDVKTEENVSARQLKLDKESLTSTNYNMNMLKKKKSLTTKHGYVPPANIEEIIKNVGSKYFGDEWNKARFADPICKFKVLSEIISQTNHDVPNTHLSDMNNMSDVIQFFGEEVKEASVYEELAAGKLAKLPKNLSIQLEAHRFDPETDTMFGGRTAFPGSDTVVTSIKYKRKYKDIKTTKEKPGFANYYYGY